MMEALTARPRRLPDNEKKILLLTTVDIGDGRSANIEVREGDDPLVIAAMFCQENGLPDGIVGHLAVHILENLAQAVLEEVQEFDEEQQPAAHYTGNPFLQDTDSMSSDLADSDIEDQYFTETETEAPLPPPSHQHHHHPQHQQSHPLPTVPKVDPSLPAHDRLYCEHFRREMIMEQRRQIRDLELQASMGQIHVTPLSKALTANRDANGYSNYGERLYIEGRIEAMRRDKDIEAARIAAEEAEVAGATFHPQITALALEMKKQQQQQQRDVGFDTSDNGAGGGAFSSSGAAPDAASHAANANGARGYTPWNRLYKLSSVAEQRRKARIEELERERKETELAECKFKPQIDPRSARMAANRVAALAENGMAPYDLLYNEADKRRRKLAEAAKKAPEEATFKPVINKDFFSSKSRRPASGSSTEADDATTTTQQQQEEEEEEPTDVALRLLNKGRKYQERLQAARDAVENNPIDPNTGRPLFKPHTRPAPSYLSNRESIVTVEDSSTTSNNDKNNDEGGVRSARRNPGGVPIGEYLYSVKQVQDQKAQEVKNAAFEAAVRAASEPKVNPKSERLMERVKQERFRAIFNYLQSRPVGGGINNSNNSDQQQQAVLQPSSSSVVPSINLVAIVSDESFMDSIDPEVRADIEYATQLFLKSQQKQLQSDPSNSIIINRITATQFAALMDRVLAKTRGLARNYLLPMAQTTRKAKFEQPTFKPELDARSLAIAGRRMRPEGVPGYEVLYRTADVVVAKREAARREVEAERMAQCTFKPSSYVVNGSGSGSDAAAARYNLMYHRQGGAVEGQGEDVAAAAGTTTEASQDLFDKEAASERKKVNEDKVMMEKEEQQQLDINNNNNNNKKVNKTKKSKQDASTSIDALENQINNVLSRLSLTGQRLAQGLQETEANPALLKSSFDYAALFGSREDVAPSTNGGGGNNDNNGASQQQPKAQKIVLPTTSLSSWAGFNPMQAEEDDAADGVVMGDLTPVGGKAAAAAFDYDEGMGDSIPAVHSGSPNRRQQEQQQDVGGGGVRKGERGSLKGLKLAELASL